MRKLLLPIFMAFQLLIGGNWAGAEESAFQGVDPDGAAHTLLQKDKKATALIFITHDCPIANGYAPEINRIVAQYAADGVDFYLVQVDPDLSAEAAKKHARDYGFKSTVLLDATHALVKLAGATTTPEAVVLSPGGKVLYRGRIDDRHKDLGKSRTEPTQRDLRNALDAILANRAVPVPETKAVGCYISDLRAPDKVKP